MKLDLKHGEHIRIAHDYGPMGTFTVFVGPGFIHVRANDQDHDGTTVEFHPQFSTQDSKGT